MGTRRVTLGIVSLLIVSGCATVESGSPVAKDPPSTGNTVPTETTEAPVTTEPETPSVNRPKPVDLTTIDICQVVGKLPLRDYELDGDRPPIGGESSIFPGSKDCFAGGITNNVSLLVVAVTSQGAQSFVDGANVAGKADSVVAGYPLTVLTPGNPDSCFGVLDVHDGQMLYLSYGLSSPTQQPVTPQPELCRTVPKIAEAAVGVLAS